MTREQASALYHIAKQQIDLGMPVPSVDQARVARRYLQVMPQSKSADADKTSS